MGGLVDKTLKVVLYVVYVALVLLAISFLCSLFSSDIVIDFLAGVLLIAGGASIICFSKLLDNVFGD